MHTIPSQHLLDASAGSATMQNPASGTYFLVMATYDSSGLESVCSAEVVKNVP